MVKQQTSNYGAGIRSESTSDGMISLRLFPSQAKAATVAARRLGVSRSKLVRIAVAEYLEKIDEMEAAS